MAVRQGTSGSSRMSLQESPMTYGNILSGLEVGLLDFLQTSLHRQLHTEDGDNAGGSRRKISLKQTHLRDNLDYKEREFNKKIVLANTRLIDFIIEEFPNVLQVRMENDSLLNKYISKYTFTELHLDKADVRSFPREIFKCINTRFLSMQYNGLTELPAGVAQLSNLECLILSNNNLVNKSIPFSITFCNKLRVLKLNDNQLEAVPGFILGMKSLNTLHRHGNHNYFKSTFMWYHTDINGRVLPLSPQAQNLPSLWQPLQLQLVAAQALVASKRNFFIDPFISPQIKEFIDRKYHMFNICEACHTAKFNREPGFKVITFKNPYLGNTCVPFQHWACSHECAIKIETPAREEQLATSKSEDEKYLEFTRRCQSEYFERDVIMEQDFLQRKKVKSRIFSSSLWCSKKSITISSSLSSSSSILRQDSPEVTSSSLWSSTSHLGRNSLDGRCRPSLLCCTPCKY